MIRELFKQWKATLIDIGLVVFLLGPTFVWATRHHSLALAAAPVLVQVLGLLVRRRYPLAVLAVTIAGSIGLQLVVGVLPPFALGVALYTVVSHRERETAIWAGLATLIVLPVTFVHQSAVNGGETLWHLVVFICLTWILGDNVRTKRAYYRALEERAARLEREHGEHAERAATAEQARIARELHDVIAHSVSVMVVQAAAANDVFAQHPERAPEALRSIEETGRSALTELRRLLGIVRTSERDNREPQPGLAAVSELVKQVRTTGLRVELELDGDLDGLPVGVDLSAYRIIQEALTNTLKHAHATSASVSVHRCARELELEISDDGEGFVDPSSDGQGLIGMRERAALLGGVIETGRAAAGGFSVRASFPLGDAPE